MIAADPDYYLREQYLDEEGRRPRLISAYYAAKPMLPPSLRIAMRRFYARRQSGQRFPRWPIEPILVEQQQQDFRRRIRAAGGGPVPFVNFWPNAARFAITLTHDVEGPGGIENIGRVREVERRYGFVSAWYFVAEDYAIPDGVFDTLRAEGCEIGLHGIHHDRKLFASRAAFDAALPVIHHYLSTWGAVGFRSPSTYRNPDWMPELACLYDTSFSDTAPFEPQPGGCCSIHPYLLGDLVELPMTLLMDHTLWEILRDVSITRWVDKTAWLIANHGLINLLVHPDYVTTPKRLACYDRFLDFLASREEGWAALPRDVARWWRLRDSLDAGTAASAGHFLIDGLRPTLAYAHELNAEIGYEIDGALAALPGAPR